jgi:hypothetical protein
MIFQIERPKKGVACSYLTGSHIPISSYQLEDHILTSDSPRPFSYRPGRIFHQNFWASPIPGGGSEKRNYEKFGGQRIDCRGAVGVPLGVLGSRDENPSGWWRRRWRGRGERLVHGGHRGRPGAAAAVWPGEGEGGGRRLDGKVVSGDGARRRPGPRSRPRGKGWSPPMSPSYHTATPSVLKLFA